MNLAELLVSLAILVLVLTGLLSALDQGQRVWAFGAARVEAQQSVRVALERLAHDVRRAGFGSIDLPALTVAEPTRVVLHSDENGDGVIAGTGETVAWRLAGGVLRRDAGGGAQPVVNGVRALRLRYFDRGGVETAEAGDVRAVGIELTLEAHHARSRIAASLTMSARVRLRNR